MRTKLPILLVFSLVVVIVLCTPPARTQEERGVGLVQTGAGGYHALVIGNNAYTSLPRLKTAEADAQDVAALLKENYGFETTLLINATRQQTISALAAYRRKLGPDSLLLIYYAGHGINDKEASKSYWLPVDAVLEDNSNWIIADEITTALKVIPARHVLIVSDSCYSGTLTRGLGEALPPAAEREQFIQKMAAGRSRTLMASGGDEPVADGGGGDKHSVFANALLRGLRVMDKGTFTAAELFRYHVEQPVAGTAEQTPEYNPLRNSGHESGDFVFTRMNRGVRIAGVAPANTKPASTESRAMIPASPSASNAPLSAPPTRPKAGVVVRSRAGIDMVYLPSGEFMMGSENGEVDEKPVRRVVIREGFYVGRYEVTQAQWRALMGTTIKQQRDKAGSDAPLAGEGDDYPMYYVNWEDAQEFVKKLNAQNDAFVYRLPSEAEWEYACRAGTTEDNVANLGSVAWYGNNSGKQQIDAAEILQTEPDDYVKRIAENGGQTHPVGQKQPNAFGLYDMLGNVWEWCRDYYHNSYDRAPTDGSVWLHLGETDRRIMRGGSWNYIASNLRPSFRGPADPEVRRTHLGFRVVAVARQ
ncbi:MAG: SUMF1/EgtB/PvdO family nonheme iron enzyme [Rubrivivax sp.]|nr:SUMF1/EgtB/PvdO family nonheme iron enzyme [Pyrinomonadaceae bacterium]